MGAEVEDGVHAVVDKIMVRWSFGSISRYPGAGFGFGRVGY